MAAALVAAPAQSAWAAVAAPNGRAGAACTDTDPCDVRSALRAAGANGEVALRAGTYDLRGASQLVIDAAVWMHGPVGGPRPVLIGDASGGVVRVADRAAVLEHVSVEPVANARRGIEATSGVARDVIVRVSATGAVACELVNGMVVSSVCWSSGSGGSGVIVDAATNDAAGVIVGSTISGQIAVRATSNAGHSATVAVDSSILMGGLGGHDIATSGTGEQRVITSYSNFDDTVGPGFNSLGGDQRAVPILADPVNGDFHQREGSPTIDAGSPVNNIDHGRFDIDGDQRVLGGCTDIGADELGPARVEGPAPGDSGADPGGGSGDTAGAPKRRSGKPARITRLRVVFRGSAASARRAHATRARAMFRLDHASSVRLTLTRVGRSSDQRTSAVVRGKGGFNDLALSGRIGRAIRRSGSYVLEARPNGGRPVTVRFRLGRGPDRFASTG